MLEYDSFDIDNEADKPQEMAERFRAVKQNGKFVHFANRPSCRFFGRFHLSKPVTGRDQTEKKSSENRPKSR